MTSLSLANRSIIITGAASGIGKATALLAAENGAHIIVADLNEDNATATVSEITQAGGAATAVAGDVSDPEVVTRLVETATQAGPLRGLINNAGVMDLFAGVAETDDTTWERCLRINVTAPFLLMRAVLPHMLETGGGSIVNIVSEAALRGAAAGAAYTSSKHALVGLTRNTAYTYAHHNIRCNAVAPGGVDTNIMSSIDPSTINQTGLNAITPVHKSAIRNAKPVELATLICFLASDEASNINGAIVPCDGGWFAG